MGRTNIQITSEWIRSFCEIRASIVASQDKRICKKVGTICLELVKLSIFPTLSHNFFFYRRLNDFDYFQCKVEAISYDHFSMTNYVL